MADRMPGWLAVVLLTSLVQYGGAVQCPETLPCNCTDIVTVTQDKEGPNKTESIIDCSGRELTSLPNFSELYGHTFQRIVLSNNKITTLPKDSFKGLSVKSIDLSNNDIMSIVDKAFDGLSGLEELYLYSCDLAGTSVALGVLENLQTLDLHDNHISNLDQQAFITLTKLRVLNLSDNQVQFASPFKSFEGLGQLQEMNIASNKLTNVPSSVLSHVPNLKKLNISNNAIESFANGIFEKVKGLEELDLDGNPMTIGVTNLVPFKSLTNLQLFKLGGCAMPIINGDMFDFMPKIATLSLTNCHIKTIVSGTFAGLKKLTNLDLSGNPEVKITMEKFYGVESRIQSLGLDRMGFTAFPRLELQNLRNLRVISLNGNNIKHLPSGVFGFFRSRNIEVYVDGNNITDVSPEVLFGLPLPVTLSLRDNKIASLDFMAENPCFFDRSVIDVSGNPLKCDCKTHKLVQKKIVKLQGVCDSPEKYHDMILAPPFKQPPSANHLEWQANDECSPTVERFNVRYDCNCKTYLDINSLMVCASKAPDSYHVHSPLIILVFAMGIKHLLA